MDVNKFYTYYRSYQWYSRRKTLHKRKVLLKRLYKKEMQSFMYFNKNF